MPFVDTATPSLPSLAHSATGCVVINIFDSYDGGRAGVAPGSRFQLSGARGCSCAKLVEWARLLQAFLRRCRGCSRGVLRATLCGNECAGAVSSCPPSARKRNRRRCAGFIFFRLNRCRQLL
jgi:hypothetical protein